MSSPEPVVLEIASLTREQLGPFLILGVDKAADAQTIDAHWAERVRWARKGQCHWPLTDINWAREVLQDAERRLQADASGWNPDTTTGLLRQLREACQKQVARLERVLWDVEKDLSDYRPAGEVPDLEQARAGCPVPQVPQELPVIFYILRRLMTVFPDPWDPLPGLLPGSTASTPVAQEERHV
jgi:hypothetical protein